MSLAEVLPTLNKLTRQQKLRLIRKWTKELGIEGDYLRGQSKKIYYVYSPYDAYGAGDALLKAKKGLQKRKAKSNASQILQESSTAKKV
mgnify:CR=1 FL=1